MLYRGDDPIQDGSTKNRPVFGLGSSFGEPHPYVLLLFPAAFAFTCARTLAFARSFTFTNHVWFGTRYLEINEIKKALCRSGVQMSWIGGDFQQACRHKATLSLRFNHGPFDRGSFE